MPKALAEVASLGSLSAAWHRLYSQTRTRSRDGYGIDGESPNKFRDSEAAKLRQLSFSVLKEKYNFSPLVAHFVPKPHGGARVICVPTVRDRIVQRSILDYLTKHYMEAGKKSGKLRNPISYGFIKGRTVREAVHVAAKIRDTSPWVYKTDITSFFDRVSRERLRKGIERHVTEKTLHAILIAASECEIDESKRTTQKELTRRGIKKGVGVRQGMPLSPVFANLLMVDFDRTLGRKKVKAIRYADDLIFFASSKEEALKHHQFCTAELAKIGLEVPSLDVANSKSKIFAPDEVADFLGLGIAKRDGVYRPIVTSDQFLVIRERFIVLGQLNQLVSRRIRLATFGAVLDATVAGYASSYQFCENIEEVENQLQEFREAAIKHLLKDGLKVDLGSLSNDARIFLGF